MEEGPPLVIASIAGAGRWSTNETNLKEAEQRLDKAWSVFMESYLDIDVEDSVWVNLQRAFRKWRTARGTSPAPLPRFDVKEVKPEEIMLTAAYVNGDCRPGDIIVVDGRPWRVVGERPGQTIAVSAYDRPEIAPERASISYKTLHDLKAYYAARLVPCRPPEGEPT